MKGHYAVSIDQQVSPAKMVVDAPNNQLYITDGDLLSPAANFDYIVLVPKVYFLHCLPVKSTARTNVTFLTQDMGTIYYPPMSSSSAFIPLLFFVALRADKPLLFLSIPVAWLLCKMLL